MFNFLKGLTHQENPQEKFKALRAKGLELMGSRQNTEAISTFMEALKIYPNAIQIMGYICLCYYDIQEYPTVIDLASRALLIAQNLADKDNIGRFYGYIACSYKETMQFEKAIKYYKLAIANKPHYLNNYYDLGICYHNLGLYEKSIDAFEDIKVLDKDYALKMGIGNMIDIINEELNTTSPDRIHLAKGFDLEDSGNSSLALAEYLKAYEINPKNTIALYRIFLLKSANNETEEALTFGLRTIESTKNDELYSNSFIFPRLFMEMAVNYQNINDMHNSEKCNTISDYYSYIIKANNAITDNQEDKISKAASLYEKALAIYANDFEVYDKLLPIYISNNRYPDALKTLEQAFSLAQKRKNRNKMAKYFNLAAFCFLELENHEKATEFYLNAVKTAIELDSKLSFNYDLATYYESRNNLSEALRQFENCLGYIKAGAEDTFDIESCIIRIRALMDNNSPINQSMETYNKGVTLYSKGQNNKAEEYFKKSLSFVPQKPQVMYHLILALRNQKKNDEAYEIANEGYLVCQRNNDLNFIDKFAYDLASHNYFINKDYQTAMNYALETIKYHPDNASYYYLIGLCFMKLQNYQAAMEALSQSYGLEANPELLPLIEACKRGI